MSFVTCRVEMRDNTWNSRPYREAPTQACILSQHPLGLPRTFCSIALDALRIVMQRTGIGMTHLGYAADFTSRTLPGLTTALGPDPTAGDSRLFR